MSGPMVAFGAPKFIKGLTVSADFYHIDLRNATRDGFNNDPRHSG